MSDSTNNNASLGTAVTALFNGITNTITGCTSLVETTLSAANSVARTAENSAKYMETINQDWAESGIIENKLENEDRLTELRAKLEAKRNSPTPPTDK